MSNPSQSYPLAIISPNLGARSETFVQRHMTDLCPNATVVIAQKDEKPEVGWWDVSAPKLVWGRSDRPPHLRLRRFVDLRLIGSSLEAERFLKKHRVKVMLSEYLDSSVAWLRTAQRVKVDFWAYGHGYDVSQRLQNPFWRREYLKLNEATGVFTMSQLSRANLIECGLAADKIHVVPYGIDVPPTSLTRSLGKVGERVRALAVGRMVAKKAPILLLESFRRAHVQYPALELDYIGDGRLAPAVYQFVRAMGLQDAVRLHSATDNATVQRLMRESDIFLQHSIVDPDTGDTEGLPVSILEAMSNSLPIVSTRHAGIPESVEENHNGFLVDEWDVQAMSGFILQLCHEPEKRLEMGLRSWELARQKFDWRLTRQILLEKMNLKDTKK